MVGGGEELPRPWHHPTPTEAAQESSRAPCVCMPVHSSKCSACCAPPLHPKRLLSRGGWLSLPPYRSGTISTLLLAMSALGRTSGVSRSGCGFGSACVVLAVAAKVAPPAAVPPSGSGLARSMDSTSSALLQAAAGAEQAG